MDYFWVPGYQGARYGINYDRVPVRRSRQLPLALPSKPKRKSRQAAEPRAKHIRHRPLQTSCTVITMMRSFFIASTLIGAAFGIDAALECAELENRTDVIAANAAAMDNSLYRELFQNTQGKVFYEKPLAEEDKAYYLTSCNETQKEFFEIYYTRDCKFDVTSTLYDGTNPKGCMDNGGPSSATHCAFREGGCKGNVTFRMESVWFQLPARIHWQTHCSLSI
eukprot:SAG31_NODE_210_length_20286_cov_22.684748_12_plen_222_part_00